MNKKGFTLVELIGVIVILAVLSILAVTTYTNVVNRTNQAQVKEKILNIEKAAMEYGQSNKSSLTSNCSITVKHKDNTSTTNNYSNCNTGTTVNYLIQNNWLESEEKDSSGNITLINNVTKEDMKNKKVFIYRNNNRVYAMYCEEVNSSECIKNEG